MKTCRAARPYPLSDARGTRELGPGDVVTSAELAPFEPDVAHCFTEDAAPAPPKPAPQAEP